MRAQVVGAAGAIGHKLADRLDLLRARQRDFDAGFQDARFPRSQWSRDHKRR
jgi:hypothetical protein